MSTMEMPDRPAFRATEQDVEIETRRVSRLAISSLVVGVLSLLSLLSSVLLPLAALALGLGIVSMIRIARVPGLCGSWLAQLGLGLGIISIASTVTFARQSDDYLYRTAGMHAETFLDYLSREDKYYDALELLRTERDRQLTGTDLRAYYESSDLLKANGKLEGFLSDAATRVVLESRGSADWRYQRGIRMTGNYRNRYITVEMRNEAVGQGEVVLVTLQRVTDLLVDDEGKPTAHWNVYDLGVEF